MFDGLFNLLFGNHQEKKPKQQPQSPIRVVQSSSPRPLSLAGQQQSSPIRVVGAPKPAQPAKPFDLLHFLGDAAHNIGHVAGDVVHGLEDTAAKAGNTVALGVEAPAAAITGANKNPAVQQHLYDVMKKSFITPEVASGRATPGEFAKQFTNAGVQTSNLIPTGGVATGLAKGLSREGALKAFLGNVKQAGVFGTANTVNDTLQGHPLTPQSVLSNYVAPAALGTGSEVLGDALRSGANLHNAAVARDVAANGPRALEAGYARMSKEVGPDGKQILKPYVKGTAAQSKEFNIPVSTPETRRQPIKVAQPRGNRETKYVVTNTHDNNGKPTYDLIPLNNKKHTLTNGMVTDKKGKPVGSYLGIDDHGNMTSYVEGRPVNINGVLGDIEKWGNSNKSMTDMNRLIEQNAPNAETARKTQDFITGYKDKQESMMKAVLKQRRNELSSKEKELNSALPRGISKDELSGDLFRAAESKADLNELRAKYGDDFMDKHFVPALQWSRETYDNMLNRANNVLQRNGFDAIPKRSNYITHIQEDPTFWEKFGVGIQDINPMGSSIDSDINPGRTRGGVPDEIVGNTANTNARRKFNQFAQQRKGKSSNQDFFAAHDAYYEPMLHNEYMTPAASRARVVEKAFRLNDKAREKQLEEMSQIVGLDQAKEHMKALTKHTHKNYEVGRRSPLVMAWQEYGNMLAGKTNAIDRTIIDAGGKGGQAAINASNKLQGITGASTIPGSATAALAQVLSLPQTVGRDSIGSVLKATKDMLTFEGKRAGTADPMRKSAFMRARYTDASSQRLSAMRKYTHAASKPMEAIERTTGELSWRSAYHEALKRGETGQKAIDTADLAAKKTLAGRGIGDRPMAMNSKALGAVTQFGLEVNNMRLQFFNEFSPAQKLKFITAAAALNYVYKGLTGNSPLPDYIGAGAQTAGDFSNSNDDKKDTAGDNAVQGVQRFAGETSKFIPGASTVAGMLLDDKTKQKVFGQNGDLSRFGAPPLSKALTTGSNVVSDIGKGDLGGAVQSLLGLAPTGTQLSRTLQGADAASKGYNESGGKVSSVINQNDAAQVLQALTFGKYSTPGAQSASASGLSLSPKESTFFKKLYGTDRQKAVDYFNSTIKSKLDNSDRAGTLTANGQPQVAAAAGIPNAPYPVEPYGKSSQSGNSNVAQSTSTDYKTLLSDYDALPTNERKAWNNSSSTDPGITKSISAWTGGKVKIDTVSNALARKWAQYQQDYADGKVSKIVADDRKRSILGEALSSQLDATETAISHMSKAELQSYADQKAISKDQVEKVLQIEKSKYDAGLITKETFAYKLGLTARGYKPKKAKGTRSRSTAVKSFKLPGVEAHKFRTKGAEIARLAGRKK